MLWSLMNNQQKNQHHIYFQTCLGAFFSWRYSICNQRPRSMRCWAFSQWEAHMASSLGSGGDKSGWMHSMQCWWLPPKIFVRCHSYPTLLLQEWSMSYSSSPPLHFVGVCKLMRIHAWCHVSLQNSSTWVFLNSVSLSLWTFTTLDSNSFWACLTKVLKIPIVLLLSSKKKSKYI